MFPQRDSALDSPSENLQKYCNFCKRVKLGEQKDPLYPASPNTQTHPQP